MTMPHGKIKPIDGKTRLEYKTYKLFIDLLSPNKKLEQLRQAIRADIKQLLNETLEKAVNLHYGASMAAPVSPASSPSRAFSRRRNSG